MRGMVGLSRVCVRVCRVCHVKEGLSSGPAVCGCARGHPSKALFKGQISPIYAPGTLPSCSVLLLVLFACLPRSAASAAARPRPGVSRVDFSLRL